MTTKIEAKRGDADTGQARGQASEEATLLAGDAPAMHQQNGTRRWLLGSNEGSCEMETVECADSGSGAG
ncbi:hypothetical protein IFM12276_05850 [Nocardia sputorum]|uniref:Uncharacterized protein n=1 Tax=Nocardia sputorum TaxID=2984338 RepID=A0ABM8CRG6_9NOCA|nr:hypothetical protein IFM12276_05850 [Nocardia sputorum]